MTVLLDTPVWSLAYRRRTVSPVEQALLDEFRQLVRTHRAVMLGPVRQEVLAGVQDRHNWEGLRSTLRAFEDLSLTQEDFEQASGLFSQCRSAGVQGSSTDFLICAVSQRYAIQIFTTDRDFTSFAKHIDIKLYQYDKLL